MTKKFIAGGCSFTFGHELSDDDNGKTPSKKTWAHGLMPEGDTYICTASPGSGNSGIARRIFQAITSSEPTEIRGVVIMWTLLSRYDWAMPRHNALENTRWASISPWDTAKMQDHVYHRLSKSKAQQDLWKGRIARMKETGVSPFAEAIYKHGANQYHETYLSWKSIIWIQHILEKRKIPYMFTLADNTLFYNEFKEHKNTDGLMGALYSEIDQSKWFSFGDRMMGFNQWATINDYEYATTHPLDKAHEDAVQLMLPTFNKLIGDR
jgi:hypothetical protein